MNALECNNLSFDYPDGSTALQGVGLQVGVGETLGLIGPNGAGKSTLLLHFNGLLRGRGEVRIFGEALTPRNIKRIRPRVGLVFQDPDDQLFMPRVFDDVAFGPLCRKEPIERVHQRVSTALAEVGLDGFENRTTHRLSIGEKKRVAIATVLALDCDLLLLDEPTASLDPRARKNLLKLLHTLPQTKVIASHDLDFVWRLCTTCILLDEGKVVASGPTQAVLTDAALLESHGLEVPASLKLEAAASPEMEVV